MTKDKEQRKGEEKKRKERNERREGRKGKAEHPVFTSSPVVNMFDASALSCAVHCSTVTWRMN